MTSLPPLRSLSEESYITINYKRVPAITLCTFKLQKMNLNEGVTGASLKGRVTYGLPVKQEEEKKRRL